jgi:hypothetical protein
LEESSGKYQIREEVYRKLLWLQRVSQSVFLTITKTHVTEVSQVAKNSYSPASAAIILLARTARTTRRRTAPAAGAAAYGGSVAGIILGQTREKRDGALRGFAATWAIGRFFRRTHGAQDLKFGAAFAANIFINRHNVFYR